MMRNACLLAVLVLGLSRWSVAASENPLTQTDIGAPGCQTQPLQEADLLPLTPAQAGWLPIGLPEGDPAPPDVQEEIAETVQEVFECLMTGDLARALANYSRAYLATSLGAVRSDLSRPSTGRDQTVAVSGLYEGPWRILQLPDGRVAALLWIRVKDDPHPDPGSIAVWMFIHEDGRWRVDDVNDMVTQPGQERPVYVADLVDRPPATPPASP
jgi:hypothetical protein